MRHRSSLRPEPDSRASAELGAIHNPKWEYGHNSGYEHRRLLAEAQSRGMTQREFDEFVNSHPERFHIEDQYGNRSHRREQK
ncbi:hypothetical protein IU468_28560 [Nocardia farcinica]|uniref:GH-E family nuclease n=1 Tax=Nocardia farcinica TaxID=37329 RepID=UPI0018945981|nr:hypothetical protein [Nocardia farcinica]